MEDSPIRVAIELEGLEPSARFQAACEELAAAASEMLEEHTEVAGYAIDGDFGPAAVWTDMRPGVKGFNIGMPPSSQIQSKTPKNLAGQAPGLN